VVAAVAVPSTGIGVKRTRLRSVSKKTRRTRWPILKRLRAAALARAKDRCEACGRGTALDVHHVTKRSAGGQDVLANVLVLCRGCHTRTDWPYAKGRLRVTAIPGGFTFRVVFAADKWAAR